VQGSLISLDTNKVLINLEIYLVFSKLSSLLGLTDRKKLVACNFYKVKTDAFDPDLFSVWKLK